MRPSTLWTLLKDAGAGFINDRAMSMGAAIAYYTVFSLAPMVILIIAVTGLVWGEQAAEGVLFDELRGMMGPEGAVAVQGLVENAGRREAGIVATIIGLATLLLGATTVFGELQSALNVIWKAEPRPEAGWWVLIRTRLLSLSLILVIGFLLIVSLVVSTVITALANFLNDFAGGAETLVNWTNFLVSFGVVTALFAMIYKMLPDRKIAWRDVWVGAAVTALLFSIGKYLIGLYIGTAGVASSYGAAGALIVILVWVYYSAQILLFGAELTRAYAEQHGSWSPPAEYAKPAEDAPAAR